VDPSEGFSFPRSMWELAVEPGDVDGGAARDARLGFEDCMLRCWFSG